MQTLSLEVIAASREQTAERLRAQLDQVVIPDTTNGINALVRIHAGDPPAERAQIERIPAAWRRFLPLADRAPLMSGSGLPSAMKRAAVAATVQARLDPLIAFVAGRQRFEIAAATAANASARHTYKVNRTWLIVSAVVALMAGAIMVRLGFTLKSLLDDNQAEAQDHGQASSEYIDTLQATENEGEAQELLRRHVERTHPGTRAVVLARNNSAARLEATTSLGALDELRGPLEHATPRACLAVRFARGHSQGGDRTPLTSCEPRSFARRLYLRAAAGRRSR